MFYPFYMFIVESLKLKVKMDRTIHDVTRFGNLSLLRTVEISAMDSQDM
jgi:hypothetical protein